MAIIGAGPGGTLMAYLLAEQHGKPRPQFCWDFWNVDDLTLMDGSCELFKTRTGPFSGCFSFDSCPNGFHRSPPWKTKMNIFGKKMVGKWRYATHVCKNHRGDS